MKGNKSSIHHVLENGSKVQPHNVFLYSYTPIALTRSITVWSMIAAMIATRSAGWLCVYVKNMDSRIAYVHHQYELCLKAESLGYSGVLWVPGVIGSIIIDGLATGALPESAS